MSADLLLLNARVRPMDRPDRLVDAVALRGDRVLAVGPAVELQARFVGPSTRLWDLRGRAVLPAFSDAHLHLELTALALARAVNCRTPPVTSIGDMVERLREAAARTPAGEWVIGQGTFFQDTLLADQRYPDRHDLDRVSREHPVMVRLSFHAVALNSLALRLCGIGRETPDPPGGQIQRDASGEPTGMTRDMAHHLKLPDPRPGELRRALLEVGRRDLLAHGVTAIQEISGSRLGVQTLAALVQSQQLPLRVALSLHVPGTLALERALARDLEGVEFDERWLSDGGIKLFADGGTTAHAAAFYQPYADEPSTSGRLAYRADEIADLFEACDRAGRRVSIHAVGDRAQDAVLDGFEAFLRRRPDRRPLLHRVEHAGNLVASDARLRRYQALGLLPVPNPTFIYTFGDALRVYLGPERARQPFRFRSMLEMGFPLPGSSDCTGPEPLGLSPLFNIWCLATRQTARGSLLWPDEAISVQQGLVLFTRNAAAALGQDRERGTLEPGKLADLVVLERDPLDVPPEQVKDLRVDCTLVGGRVAYHRPGTDLPSEVAWWPAD